MAKSDASECLNGGCLPPWRRLPPSVFHRIRLPLYNAVLQKQKNINRYVHAYFSDNDEVMMELDGIDLMFSDENLKPIPIKDYREYMKERKKEAKDKAKASKRK